VEDEVEEVIPCEAREDATSAAHALAWHGTFNLTRHLHYTSLVQSNAGHIDPYVPPYCLYCNKSDYRM